MATRAIQWFKKKLSIPKFKVATTTIVQMDFHCKLKNKKTTKNFQNNLSLKYFYGSLMTGLVTLTLERLMVFPRYMGIKKFCIFGSLKMYNNKQVFLIRNILFFIGKPFLDWIIVQS